MMEVLVTTGARHAKLQSNHYHQHTDTQLLTGWMPFLSPNQLSENIEGHCGSCSVIFVNENENYQKRKNNHSVNEN